MSEIDLKKSKKGMIAFFRCGGSAAITGRVPSIEIQGGWFLRFNGLETFGCHYHPDGRLRPLDDKEGKFNELTPFDIVELR